MTILRYRSRQSAIAEWQLRAVADVDGFVSRWSSDFEIEVLPTVKLEIEA